MSHKKSGGRVLSGWLIQQLHSVLMNSAFLCFVSLCSALFSTEAMSLSWWLDLTEASGSGQVQLYLELEESIPPWLAPSPETKCFLVAPGKLSFRFTWQGLRCSPVLWMYRELGSWGFGIWVSIGRGGSFQQENMKGRSLCWEVGGVDLCKLDRQATSSFYHTIVWSKFLVWVLQRNRIW